RGTRTVRGCARIRNEQGGIAARCQRTGCRNGPGEDRVDAVTGCRSRVERGWSEAHAGIETFHTSRNGAGEHLLADFVHSEGLCDAAYGTRGGSRAATRNSI